ncbi:MAG: hypothetical protein QGG71_01865 [Pirellulaceae bacterium]|jgi:tetratricopeptide (TPR) repeat protein|nr:hypothetical protein [Pirellulaceae bacterium]
MVSKLDRSTIVTLCILVLLCLAGVSVPGYRWWKTRQKETLKARCAQALKDKEWDQLETCATAWLDLDKDNGFAWLYLGQAVQQKGDFERAAECLGALDDSHPRCLPALLELVEMQLAKLNRPLDAVETCHRIIKIDPNVTKAHQRLIFFYAMTLQRREMIRAIRRAIDLNAAQPEAYAYLLEASSLRFSNGYQINTHWLKSDPENEQFQVARAIFWAKTEEPSSEAGPTKDGSPSSGPIEECRRKFPEDAEILAYLLENQVLAGNTSNVESLLATAPASAELDGRFWRFKGWYHAARNELDEAEQAYRESLKWDPYDWRSRHQLATVLRRQNKLDEVERMTELALEGKKLERDLRELPNMADVSVEIARDIADLAESAGDLQVANGIRRSLEVSP